MSNRKSQPAASDAASAVICDNARIARLRPLHAQMLHLLHTEDTDRDLTARQLAVLLRLRLDPAQHTVRGLAAALGVSKPAITRALDRLEYHDLALRTVDEMDRRSSIVTLTRSGREMMDALAEV